jgi:L-threonylcarbamoyladenylate synthase
LRVYKEQTYCALICPAKAIYSVVVLFMSVLKLNEENIEHALHHAVDILMEGGIVVYPTETFYGIGVKFDRQDSLHKLQEIKQRPENKAIPLIIGSRDLLTDIVSSVNNNAVSLMDKFWPGPLTLILQAKETLSPYITAGTHSVAVRIPGDSFALRLAHYARFPITATSANPSGKPPAKDTETVINYFGGIVDLIIDGGTTKSLLPSTIVDARGENIEIVREGAIKRDLLMCAHDSTE